LYAIIVNFQPF